MERKQDGMKKIAATRSRHKRKSNDKWPQKKFFTIFWPESSPLSCFLTRSTLLFRFLFFSWQLHSTEIMILRFHSPALLHNNEKIGPRFIKHNSNGTASLVIKWIMKATTSNDDESVWELLLLLSISNWFRAKRAAKYEQLFCMSSERSCLELGPSTALYALDAEWKENRSRTSDRSRGPFCRSRCFGCLQGFFWLSEKKADLSATKWVSQQSRISVSMMEQIRFYCDQNVSNCFDSDSDFVARGAWAARKKCYSETMSSRKLLLSPSPARPIYDRRARAEMQIDDRAIRHGRASCSAASAPHTSHPAEGIRRAWEVHVSPLIWLPHAALIFMYFVLFYSRSIAPSGELVARSPLSIGGIII